MNLAPIVIFTFNRLDHTKKTVESLKKNNLSKESEVFIFSDGPRNKEELNVVNKVRSFIRNINGFKKVTVIESKINKGLANSVIDGVTNIIQKYGRVIVLEDDLITSPYFLEYMNEALSLYESRSDIWSISGYTPNIILPDNYKDEVYLIKRGSSWGWATWENRWKLNDWTIKEYSEFKKDKKMKIKFNKSGTDMTPMLNDQMEGRINSWAIRWVYNQFKYNMWTVYPVKSLVKNIGMDLSGTHSVSRPKLIVKLGNYKIKLNKHVCINEKILYEFKKIYDLKFSGYIGIVIKKIGLYRQARDFRNKIIRLNLKLSR